MFSNRILAAAAVTWLAAVSLPAQTTFATITGAITDPSGTAIPNAGVEVVQAQTGYRYTTQSNDAGIYTLPQLREGAYTLKVQAPGFKESVAQDIQLVARETRRIDWK